jgi:hypothetical protein
MMFSLLSLIIWFCNWFSDAELWWQIGTAVLIGCLVLCIPYRTRRPAFTTFILLALGFSTWNYVKTEYDKFTPGDVAIKKKWLR